MPAARATAVAVTPPGAAAVLTGPTVDPTLGIMIGLVFGVGAGIFILGGWWSLIAFCAIVSAGIGAWRIFGAYRRLGNDLRTPQDAHNLALTSGAENPEEEANRIMAGGRLPDFKFTMLMRASAWEFAGCVIGAVGARLTMAMLGFGG